MLRSAVRPPISTSSTTTAPSATSFKMNSNNTSNISTAIGTHGNGSNNSNEGKEIIIPLKRRPIFYRLDVLPFLLCYIVLILVDVLLLLTNNGGNDDDAGSMINTSGSMNSWLLPIAMDVAYIVLLIMQLVLFLKCSWDPVWHAKVAYYWLNYDAIAAAAIVANNRFEDPETQRVFEDVMKSFIRRTNGGVANFNR
jgi:hypothetical protein